MERKCFVGGIFVNNTDMANWLVGEEPETVYATGHASHPLWVEVGDFDTSTAVLKYPRGSMAMVDASRNTPVGLDRRLEV